MRHLYYSEHIITPVSVSEAGDGARCIGHSLVPPAPTITCVSFSYVPCKSQKTYRVLMTLLLFPNASKYKDVCVVFLPCIIMCNAYSYNDVRY